jgi:hypothetical protein
MLKILDHLATVSSDSIKAESELKWTVFVRVEDSATKSRIKFLP